MLYRFIAGRETKSGEVLLVHGGQVDQRNEAFSRYHGILIKLLAELSFVAPSASM